MRSFTSFSAPEPKTKKHDVNPGLWLAETFLTSSLKPLNWFQRNLTRSKIWCSKFVLFLADPPPISRSAHERGATGSPAVHPLSHTQTDQTTNSGNSLHTGPDVSYLSESSPIPRWSKTPAQDPRPLKRGQTWRTPDKQRPPRSRRTPPPIVRDQLNTWINTG